MVHRNGTIRCSRANHFFIQCKQFSETNVSSHAFQQIEIVFALFGKKYLKKSSYLARLLFDLRFICLSHFVVLR